MGRGSPCFKYFHQSRASALQAMAHVCQYLSSVASRHPDRPLFTCEDSQRTAAQVLQRVAALATCLRQRHGIAPGDRVLLAGHNTDLFLEALLAITAVGAIAAPINWRWSTVEAADAAVQCGATLLLHDSACASFAAMANNSRCPALRGARLLSVEGPSSGAVGSTMEPLLHNQDAAAVICFTSGTTGRPKGVLVSHTAFHCQVRCKHQKRHHPFHPGVQSAEAAASSQPLHWNLHLPGNTGSLSVACWFLQLSGLSCRLQPSCWWLATTATMSTCTQPLCSTSGACPLL